MSWLGSFFASEHETAEQFTSVLDLITYVAGLASRPQDIDITLDRVRTITAKLIPGKSLSQADEQQLLDVYLKLEHYLSSAEPIKAFTIEGLRSHCAPGLRQRIEVSAGLLKHEENVLD